LLLGEVARKAEFADAVVDDGVHVFRKPILRRRWKVGLTSK
jgi:hypothetical protein